MNDNIFRITKGCEDNIELTRHGDGITITIEEPWNGDSNYGFGKECSLRIDYDEALELGNWLIMTAEASKYAQEIQGSRTPTVLDTDPVVAAYMKMAMDAEQEGNSELANSARHQAEQAKAARFK